MDQVNNFAPPETKLHFLDYWRVIRIRKAIIITVFLITAIIATAVTFILPESYASTARIKVEPDENIGLASSVAGSPYDPYFIQTTFEIMQSQIVLSNVIIHLDLNAQWGKKYANGETLKTSETMEILKKRMNLAPVRNTKLIAITVYSENKDEAAQIANGIATAYKNYRFETRRELTSQGVEVLQQQYRELEEVVKTNQDYVEELRQKLNITGDQAAAPGFTPTFNSEQLAKYHDLQIEGERVYKESLVQLQELQTIAKTDKNKLRDVLPTVFPDSVLSDLLGKLHESQQKMVTLTNDYALTNFVVTRVQSLMDELNHEIDARVDGILLGLQSQVNSKKAALDTLTQAVEDSKTKDQEEFKKNQPYYDQKRKLEDMQDFQKVLTAKISAQRLEIEAPKNAMVQVTDLAEAGKEPVEPKKALNIVLGLVFGLVMGIGLAFFIEYLDTSVKTIDDVERTFQAPVLGVIPQNIGYLLDEGTESKNAEAYRVLRTNILFSRKDEKPNSVVVVSAGAGEGKSTTSVNLATVFAQAGSRVLIVDSDLRRPTLHKIFKVTNKLGLTNYLLQQNTLAEIVQASPVPNLDFMASGKLPNSSMGILGSAKMKEMIADLKQRYDFIFFDSPPILGVSDASVLASEVDLVIQVIQYRRYPQPMTIRAKQMIEKVGGHLVGIVLNNINMSQDEGYYYYSGYYHDYYYSRDASEQEAEAEAKAKAKTVPGAAPVADDTGIKQKY
jgi:capsular exopolysaccharide synthesis family protein